MLKEFFCREVALTNDLKLLRRVREEKECDWDCQTSGNAAYHGNLDMLKFCIENGRELDKRHCATAAYYGNLDCLKYLRTRNCPRDERVCVAAHEDNEIECLSCAVKHEAPDCEHYEQLNSKSLSLSLAFNLKNKIIYNA